jgi:agmatine deiminase
MARTLETTPREDGFRMPADFEEKAGCWHGWPERRWFTQPQYAGPPS